MQNVVALGSDKTYTDLEWERPCYTHFTRSSYTSPVIVLLTGPGENSKKICNFMIIFQIFKEKHKMKSYYSMMILYINLIRLLNTALSGFYSLFYLLIICIPKYFKHRAHTSFKHRFKKT